MQIKAIRQTRNPDKLDLIFEDESKLRILATLVPDLGLYAKMEVDTDLLARIREANEQASAKVRAVRIVSASNVSQAELRRRLIQKGENPAFAAEAVGWLVDLGAVDDQKTANLLAQRAAAKGYGKARIRQELYQKGIPKEFWDAAMEGLPEPDDAIDRFLQQKLRGSVPDEKEKKRLTDALCRRGHRWSDIKAAWGRYLENLDEAWED